MSDEPCVCETDFTCLAAEHESDRAQLEAMEEAVNRLIRRLAALGWIPPES
ncbi:hypothetical protein [Amycolatopsis orientalis]|uniref:hypothetical protein n=1 Tax=Amycolatopsis orientalis TaxID=31958 RepID=UPI0003AA8D22|nr:hypothetical protein [Amycolatopsis orientalis]